MSVSISIRNTNNYFEWVGRRVVNTSYDDAHNLAVNQNIADRKINPSLSEIPIDPFRYYQYLPKTLDYLSAPEYATFIADVNWKNGRASEEQDFPNSPPKHDWNSVATTEVDTQKVNLALERWKNVFNIDNANANITIAYASIDRIASGVTYVGGNNVSIGGENYTNQYAIFINEKYYGANSSEAASNVNTADLSLGTWGGWTLMHELGHVWGLQHTNPGVNNDLRFSIMAYPDNFISHKIPLTPGMADIKAMQIKYGLSDAQDGNTNYVFTQSSIDLGHGNILANVQTNVNINRYVLTISDRQGSAGGIDTIDASALATNVYINLNVGEFSAIGTDWNKAPTTGENYNGKGDLDGDTKFNVGIAVGAHIENAKGGSGNDYCQSASKTFH